jgi:branched-chain amino acid transport system substrate-binding protein
MKKPTRNLPAPALQTDPANLTRRRFLRTTAASVVAATTPSLLFTRQAYASARTIKIGFVNPRTAMLAPFGEGEDFVLAGVRKLLTKGLVVNGAPHPVEIIDKDSASDPARAADLASALIKSDKVDLMLAASTGDTVTPVSDLCEKNGVPCITTNTPWQVYLMGRGGNLNPSFDWTYHFFWGMEDVIAVFTNMWSALPTNKVVGALWPDEADGYAHADPTAGFPAALQMKGFRLVDPGRFPRSTTDYSAQINTFKSEKVEILTGVLPPPAFAEFWRQARQLDFHPKVATIAKALLFPSALEALGDYGGGLTTEVWWSPSHPYISGLNGQNAAEFCAAYEDTAHRQWTQPIGFLHALFEVGIDVLKRTKDIDSPASIRNAIRSTDYHSLVGHIAWDGHPHKNIAKTTLVGGQWLPGSKFKNWAAGQKFKYDLVIVNNQTDTTIGTQRQLEPLSAG